MDETSLCEVSDSHWRMTLLSHLF